MNAQVYTKNESLLCANNIGLQYGEKVILRDINFCIKDIHRPDMQQGQVVSLIGRSGIGKTQLFKILAGLNKPTSGEILIDVDQHPVVAGEVGIVPQNYILFNHRTIYQNLKIGLDNGTVKLTDAEKKMVIQDYAHTFQLTEHLEKYPAQLSGGQRQRVSIIQQVLTGNKFILLDEPFSGLDMVMINKVIQLLLKVSTIQETNTLILVSHDIVNAAAISDTVWVLGTTPEKEGATIIKEYDLCAMGLAWQPEIRKEPEFHSLVHDIQDLL
ncbi:ABC transporter ATP-binding protein [Chitinophaga sp. Cy-1792]|uniref:ABC transporter ATP-binding protein n=1 Tax=Chitinophaga sp. Cy-1792 TaxID=2608339 RepID=UPI0014203022|nr:ATP-binding cassette domain-containing protein [Chitinophaga sp. Cy-1792]NIG52016.1 ABC transporter ATP-binding protein [Chitinophaga sp. Cy-1792]